MSTSRRRRSGSSMIIFDFDLTLVDTQPVEALRAARKWRAVMSRAPELKVYDGVHELLVDLDACGQTLAIVTKSPDMVPRHFVERYRWPIGIVLGYHQVRRRKPDPEAPAPGHAKGRCQSGQDVSCRRPAGGYGSCPSRRGDGDWRRMGTGRHRDLEASKPDFLFLCVQELREYFLEVL